MVSAPDKPRPFTYAPPPAGALPIVHADDHILVLDKPAGLLTVAGNTPELADCLEARVRTQYPTATMIHRLDMDTSGLIVLALTPGAHAHIGKQFEKRLTRKTYIALVWGQMAQASGRIDQPMKSDWPNRPKQHVDPVDGRAAVTDWQVLETGPDRTRLCLTPLTGRTHQLRVHMAFLGHPILGDNLYAPEDALAASDRLCLHAGTLEFRHPDGGAPVRFDSPAPF
ncbi:RluA family pseudouridine synthase [Maricaulis salignorans]|uniref:Dual-specificity RNA pseudouridine synthase RluA n=1 Tax=Maricaulis salignorans TaxID=144026 RepID=A0A1G9MQX7_9PROT|nr:RluA family pseudouridine synthase [Maricaulis salignorans]SDL76045.1 ribosomal large subunit pseudouridine synthase A [Maricaulis salignorans]